MTTSSTTRRGARGKTTDAIDLAHRRAAAFLGRLHRAQRTGQDTRAAEQAYAIAMRELGRAWDAAFEQGA